jgi:hypothetical protein
MQMAEVDGGVLALSDSDYDSGDDSVLQLLGDQPEFIELELLQEQELKQQQQEASNVQEPAVAAPKRKRSSPSKPRAKRAPKKSKTSNQDAAVSAVQEEIPYESSILARGITLDRPGFITESLILPLGFKSIVRDAHTGLARALLEITESNGQPQFKVTVWHQNGSSEQKPQGDWHVLSQKAWHNLAEDLPDTQLRQWLATGDPFLLGSIQQQLRQDLKDRDSDDDDEDEEDEEIETDEEDEGEDEIESGE